LQAHFAKQSADERSLHRQEQIASAQTASQWQYLAGTQIDFKDEFSYTENGDG